MDGDRSNIRCQPAAALPQTASIADHAVVSRAGLLEEAIPTERGLPLFGGPGNQVRCALCPVCILLK